MKKILKAVGMIVLAIVLVAFGYKAGQKNQLSSITSALPRETIEEVAPTAAPMPSKAPEAVQPERNIIEKNSETAIQEDLSEVQTVGVTMSDSSEAEVKVYTSAQNEDNGEFMWEDRNQWIIEVKTNGGYYTLVNKFVQHGKVNVTVATDEKGECVIMAVTSSGSGFSVEKYTFNGTAFEGQSIYNSGVLNVLGSTF